jgi:SAM-dependent methyltransferase
MLQDFSEYCLDGGSGLPADCSKELTLPEGVAADYLRNGNVLRWEVPSALESAVDVVYRNDFIRRLSQRDVPDILENYVYLSVEDMKRQVSLAAKYMLRQPIKGIGLDLGAGSGLLASVVAHRSLVNAVLAIEVCEEAAKLLIPKVASWVLGRKSSKVVPVIASFDNLQLADCSVDFAVEIESFHHSYNLSGTFAECARVLKPGGWLLCFDRCWPDSHPDSDLERLLNVVYPREYMVAHGYPPDMVMRRRDNGEHEYKLFEWKDAISSSGLKLETMCKFRGEVSLRHAIKGCISFLPTRYRRIFYGTDNADIKTTREWLVQKKQTAIRLLKWRNSYMRPEHWPQMDVFAPREVTAFLLRKPL